MAESKLMYKKPSEERAFFMFTISGLSFKLMLLLPIFCPARLFYFLPLKTQKAQKRILLRPKLRTYLA
jgi:hypothetical protein